MQHNVIDKFSQSSKTNVTAVWLREGGDGSNSGIWSKGARATALFSCVVIPQPARGPRSMKFGLFNKTAAAAPSVPVKQLIIPSTAYDDPAFSPDPHSNPFFASDHLPGWDPSLPPGHPTLKKHHPLDHDNFHPLQPPNSPALPDAPNSSTNASAQSSHPSTTLSHPPPAATTGSSSPPSTSVPASSSTHVRPKNDMPHDGHHPPRRPPQPSSSKPEHKKRSGLFSRLMGSPPSVETPISTARPTAQDSTRPKSRSMTHSQDPPPYELVSRSIPQQTPTAQSAPEMYRSERPTLRPRANTGEMAESRIIPAVAAAATLAADDHRGRGDLDKIDELDESNPFGATWHHGGPYEAISRIVQKDITRNHGRAQAQLSNPHGLPLSHDIYKSAQLMALKSGGLNLKPGQVLPHDFASYSKPSFSYLHPQPNPHPQPQLIRSYDHQDHPSHAQLSIQGHEPRPLVNQLTHSQMASSAPQLPFFGNQPGMEPSPVTDPRPMRHRSPSPAAATTHSDEDRDAALSIGIALMGDGQNNSHESSETATAVNSEDEDSNHSIPNDHNVQNEALGQPPAWHPHPNPPPSRTEVLRNGEHWAQNPADRGSAWNGPPINMPPQEPAPQFVPPHATSSQTRHTSWHPQSVQPSLTQLQHTRPARQEIHSLQPPPPQPLPTPLNSALGRSATYAPEYRRQAIDRSGLTSPMKAAGSTAPSFAMPSVRDREFDARSIQQSIITTSNVSSRSQDGENSHRNRYLPKRLVMPAPLQPTLENRPMTHQVRFGPQANAVYSDDLSPPQVKPPMLASQPPRAQGIPIAPSNKLRKRMSLFGGVTSSSKEKPAAAAVSFSANIIPTNTPPTRANTDRVHKRVLNKKK